MEQLKKDYQRIVIKIGASLLVNPQVIEKLISQIADLIKQKRQVILVSSGAIACGMYILGLKSRPTKLEHLQAAQIGASPRVVRLFGGVCPKKSRQPLADSPDIWHDRMSAWSGTAEIARKRSADLAFCANCKGKDRSWTPRSTSRLSGCSSLFRLIQDTQLISRSSCRVPGD